MTAAKQIPGEKFLKTLAPLGDLDAERFARITKYCKVESYEAGAKLFAIGERDNRTIYLTSGQISLTFRSGTERIITAETNQARNALVPEQPRQATAVAKTTINILVIDTDALDQVLHWNDSYEISEIDTEDDDNDWMTMFLQSKAFLKLRAQNIQALMMRLEEIPVKAGQTIIKQGDDDGFYYIVKRGKCRVARKPAINAAEIEVAILGVGAGFGEEALIMHDARGASVTMIENGQLMRLSRSDFTRLLAEPLVQIVTYKNAVKNPKSVFVDVRSYDEYVQDGMSDIEHSPLAEMRAKIHSFDHHKQYVMISNDGGRASAAAFLLCQQGLDAVVLEKGMLGLPDSVSRGNGDAGELENIPVIDNVVDFQKTQQQEAETSFDVFDDYDQLEEFETGGQLAETPSVAHEEANPDSSESKSDEKLIDDPRVNAIFERAKQRVIQEARKAKVADQARVEAEKGLQNLKQEAEQARQEAQKARKEVETASHQSAEVARLEAIKEAARMREVELGCKQAEVEEAIRQAEEEAQRAHASENAYKEAQEENARLKREMEAAVARTKEESRKSVEALQLFADQEERHFKKMAKRRVREEEKRARESEKARINSEKKLKTLTAKLKKSRVILEEQQKRYEDAESSIEKDILLQKIEILTEEKNNLELDIKQLSESIEHAKKALVLRAKAVAELEELRLNAEQVRAEAARYACIAADNSFTEKEQIAAKRNAKKLAEKQLELEEEIRESESEIARKQAIEDARLTAEEEIQRIRENAANEKARFEERALKIAEAARKEAEQQAKKARALELAAKQNEIDNAEKKALEEARRAKEAEKARVQAEKEIEKLKQDAEQTRTELEKQLSADIKRSEIEHEVARVRAEELVNKQSEIDEISKATEQASLRAMAAEEAKLNAEQEIERLKAEIAQAHKSKQAGSASASVKQKLDIDEAELLRKQQEILEIGKTLEKEAKRIQAAEDAQIEAQEEIARLRGEVESLTRQAQQQLNQDAQRAAVENASVREQANELEQKQRLIEKMIQQAQQEAQLAKDAIEAKVKAEAEVKQLKAQSDLALNHAKEMVRKSQEEVREQLQREIDQARAEGAALREAEIKEAVRKTKLESRRAEAAEKARQAAEREIERLKVASEVRRIKAEKAIKDSIKTASLTADNNVNARISGRNLRKTSNNQEVNNHQGSGVDFFNSEPQTDLEAQDEMNLLFTNVDVSDQQQPRGVMDQIKAMSNEPDKTDDESEEEEEEVTSSAWVSDQVMWEATLGIREDEKAQEIIAPKNEAPAHGYVSGRDNILSKQVGSNKDKEEDSDRTLFKGRDVNPMAIKTAAVIPPIRRRQIASILKKVKILMWLSPLIAAIAYYVSLEEQDQINLQLKISNSMSGVFGSSQKDIAVDAKQLIKDTEARIAKQKELKAKAAVVAAPVVKKAKRPVVKEKVANPENEIAKSPAKNKAVSVKVKPTGKPRSFAGKDIPFNDVPKSKPVVSAPVPTAVAAPVDLPKGKPVLPPLPDATPAATANTSTAVTTGAVPSASEGAPTEVITSVEGVASGRVINNPTPAPAEKKPAAGRTSIGELPPAQLDLNAGDGDVNADQNSATFHKKESSNLETPIAK